MERYYVISGKNRIHFAFLCRQKCPISLSYRTFHRQCMYKCGRIFLKMKFSEFQKTLRKESTRVDLKIKGFGENNTLTCCLFLFSLKYVSIVQTTDTEQFEKGVEVLLFKNQGAKLNAIKTTTTKNAEYKFIPLIQLIIRHMAKSFNLGSDFKALLHSSMRKGLS